MTCKILCRERFALVVLSLCMFVFAEKAPPPLAPGNTAPSFSLPTLSGTRQTLSVWCGKLSKPYVNKEKHVVILSFWATYCKPCQKEIPELMKFAKKHKNDKLKIFCISLDKEGASIVAPFVKKQKYSLPMLLDPYKRTALRYGVKSLPALVVIGHDGIIRYSSVGYKEDVPFQKILERAFEAAKNNKNMTVSPDEAGGESVDVKQDTDEEASSEIPPRDKWRAVARVECGEPISDVADELGAKPDEIKKWYNDLKAKAIELWKND